MAQADKEQSSVEIPIDIDATSFAVTSLSLLNEARLKNSYCDFIVRIGNENLTVHKVVLSTRSEYFEAMFRANTSESVKSMAEMKNVDFESVRKCIEYIYTGKVSVKHENIEKVMHIAFMMQLKELCKGIAFLLQKGLNDKSFFKTKQLANRYDCTDLESKCDNFALTHFGAVSTHNEFEDLERDSLIFLFSSTNLVASESVKLDAIRKWIHNEINARREFLTEFLEFVNLSKLSARYFQSILQNEPLIYESASILRNFSLTMLKTTASKAEVIAVYNMNKKGFQSLSPNSNNHNLVTAEFSAEQIPGLSEMCAVVSSENTLYLLSSNKSVYGFDYTNPDPKWKVLSSMKENNGTRLRALYLSGMIYVFNASGGEKYDESLDEWSSIAKRTNINYRTQHQYTQYNQYNSQGHHPAEFACEDSAVTAWNGQIYVIGGKLPSKNNQAVYNIVVYNCTTDAWSEDNMILATPRYEAAAATHGDNIYVIGGKTISNQVCGNIEIFFKKQNTRSCGNMTCPRSFLTACSVGETIYLLGGDQNTSVEAYNIPTNTSSIVQVESSGQLNYGFAVVIRTI